MLSQAAWDASQALLRRNRVMGALVPNEIVYGVIGSSGEGVLATAEEARKSGSEVYLCNQGLAESSVIRWWPAKSRRATLTRVQVVVVPTLNGACGIRGRFVPQLVKVASLVEFAMYPLRRTIAGQAC